MNNHIVHRSNDFVVKPIEFNKKYSAIIDQTVIINNKALALSNCCLDNMYLRTVELYIAINHLRLIAAQPLPRKLSSTVCVVGGNNKTEIYIKTK